MIFVPNASYISRFYYTDLNSQNIADLLKGKNGIYVILNNNSSLAGYSGHVDLILNGKCIGNAYTTPAGGIKSIRIWVLN